MLKRLMLLICLGAFLSSLTIAHAEMKKRTVIFDQGHGQKFVIDKAGDLQLSDLSGLLKAKGYEVRVNTGGLNDATLGTADVLIISGAFQPLSPEETGAVVRFLERGGALCVMIHIPQPVEGLLGRLRLYVSNGVIQEQENIINNEPREFFVTNMEKHDLTKGLEKIGVHGAWALMTESETGRIIARTGPKAWIDLNRDGRLDPTDARQSFGVVVAGTLGKGRYLIFGDDAVFQNKFLTLENFPLGKNLADWME